VNITALVQIGMATTYLPNVWWFAFLLNCLQSVEQCAGIAANVLIIVTKELELAAIYLNVTSDICPWTCQSVPSVFEPDYCQVQTSAAAQVASA